MNIVEIKFDNFLLIRNSVVLMLSEKTGLEKSTGFKTRINLKSYNNVN